MSTWKTEDLAQALPQTSGPAAEHASGQHDSAGTGPPQKSPEWGEAQPLDYAALANPPSDQQWDGDARVYEWKDEYGDVGPEYPELELELFGDPATRHERTGIDFAAIDQIEVQQEGPVKIDLIRSFKDAGLHPAMLANVNLAGYEVPTPIQKCTLPAILRGHDVIGIAQTGSGKTAAYLVPILSKLMGKAKKLAAPRPNPATFREGIDDVTAEPLVLVVVPTRELAVQIFNEARKFCYRTMLRPSVVYGGVPSRKQKCLLNKGCDVLIGTPGRLVDFLQHPHILSLKRLKYLVIDEADEMLQGGWHDALTTIISGGEQDSGNIKFGLFSATFPKEARDLAKQHLSSSHVRFRVGRAGSTTANIKQVVVEVEQHQKRAELLKLLNSMAGFRTIIFVNTRQGVDNLDDYLYNLGLPVTSIHSERTQVEREAAMRAFRSGKAPILVSSGLAARGIDVKNIRHVINFDLPSLDHGGIEEYTHRIGRTGRIGHRGMATSFYTSRDEPIASVLVRTLLETKQDIPDFLETFAPIGEAREKPKFETESDFDENELGDAGGDTMGSNGGDAGGWGAPADGANTSAPAEHDTGGWGSAGAAQESNGWGSADPVQQPAGW